MMEPNVPPVAIISSSDDYKVNNDIRFSGIDSYDPDGDIIRFVWMMMEKLRRLCLRSQKISNQVENMK